MWNLASFDDRSPAHSRCGSPPGESARIPSLLRPLPLFNHKLVKAPDKFQPGIKFLTLIISIPAFTSMGREAVHARSNKLRIKLLKSPSVSTKYISPFPSRREQLSVIVRHKFLKRIRRNHRPVAATPSNPPQKHDLRLDNINIFPMLFPEDLHRKTDSYHGLPVVRVIGAYICPSIPSSVRGSQEAPEPQKRQ